MTDWNAKLFVKLYSKIALALGVTPSDAPEVDHELMSIFEGVTPPRR